MTARAEEGAENAGRQKALPAAILSVSLVVLSANTISALMADMRESFPHVDKVSLQSLLTVTSVTATICILLSGALAGWLGTRRVLLCGLAVYTVAGVAPMFLSDFAAIHCSRLALGVGIGLIYPFSVSLIADFFQDGRRAKLMGLQFSSANIGLAAMLAAAGFLAETKLGWRASFAVYGIGAPVFLSVLLLVPEPPRERADTRKAGPAGRYRVTAPVAVRCLLMGLYNMMFLTVFFGLAMMTREAGFGDAAGTGLSLTAMTLSSTGVAAAFGPLHARLGRWLGVLAAASVAAGFFFLRQSGNMYTVTAALLLLGAGNAFLWPLGNTAVADAAPQCSTTFCLALLQACLNLGAFVSPYAFGALGRLFADSSGGFAFLACSLAMAAGTAGLLLHLILSGRAAGGADRMRQ